VRRGDKRTLLKEAEQHRALPLEKPKRLVSLRRDQADYLVAFQPDDLEVSQASGGPLPDVPRCAIRWRQTVPAPLRALSQASIFDDTDWHHRRGTVLIMALNDTERPIEPLRELMDTLPRPHDDVRQR
jgi:hypothetical protein